MDKTTRGAEFPETPRQLRARQDTERDELRKKHLTESYEHARDSMHHEHDNPYSVTSELGIMWHAGIIMGRCELDLLHDRMEADSADDEAEKRNAVFRLNRKALLDRNEDPK